MEHVVPPEAVERVVVLTNARGVLDETIAEFVLGCALALAKDLPGTVRRQDQQLGDYELVVVAAALAAGTRGLVGADVLQAIRSGAELVNVGHGEIVDEHAMARALAEGRLGGAMLDVSETEPSPEASPLCGMPNVTVSPHTARDFFGRRGALQEVFIDNVCRFTHRRPLRNVVDIRLGYVGTAPRVDTSREGGIG
jgi:phosphoglycerate dehydrogenase-like enzyme